MKTLVKVLFCLTLGLISEACRAQVRSVTHSASEYKQAHLLFSFLRYVKKSDTSQLNQRRFVRKYLVLTKLDADRQQNVVSMLGRLKSQLQEMDLNQYDALPWLSYPFADKLPQLVDETEPITHLMGTPIPLPEQPSTAEKSRFREAIWVGFEKRHPEQPAFFILFTPEEDKILSWTLIKQGKYHYFLRY